MEFIFLNIILCMFSYKIIYFIKLNHCKYFSQNGGLARQSKRDELDFVVRKYSAQII